MNRRHFKIMNRIILQLVKFLSEIVYFLIDANRFIILYKKKLNHLYRKITSSGNILIKIIRSNTCRAKMPNYWPASLCPYFLDR